MSFIQARLGFLVVVVLLVIVALFAIERAYRGPWGRMMRAIRDNHIAVGIDGQGRDAPPARTVRFRIGADWSGRRRSLPASCRLFDPGGYIPINHTFLIWVMVIVGGRGQQLRRAVRRGVHLFRLDHVGPGEQSAVRMGQFAERQLRLAGHSRDRRAVGPDARVRAWAW